MRIVVRVTIAADWLRVMKGCGFMASAARKVRVRSEQRKRRDVVIEPELPVPAGGDMTGFAVIAELPPMRVVVAVATRAVDW